METLISIELSEVEAKTFVKFQKHHALINLLDSLGAFNLKGGSVTIHFDEMGKIGLIDKHERYNPKISTVLP